MPTLTSMAEVILARAKKLDYYFELHGIDSPSFDNDTFEELPADLQDEQWALANDANELKQLARGAGMGTMDSALSWTDALGLRIVYHYKLANAVPLDGSASYAEIATTSGVREDLCRRFIRLAMGNHIFAEDEMTGRVRHTARSHRLATDAGLADAVGFELEDVAPASCKLSDVWEKHGQDVGEQNKTAFSMYNNTDGSIFGVFARDPERGRRFGGAMGHFTKGDSWDLRHMLASFDWQSLDKPGAKVVDIGGGHGYISQYLAQHTTNLHFVVQDLAHVVKVAPSQLSEDLKDRIDFEEHDFFTPQRSDPPPTAFLLRYILHNWADKYAQQILKNLVPAMRNGSKVFIYEYVLEDRPVTDLTGRFGFQMDGIMATLFNAQERTAAEFERVLKDADDRFVLEAVRKPEGSTMSLVEVGWKG